MIVLDTSFVVAYHNQRDAHHAAAVKAFHRLEKGEWGEILLPEYIFLEIMTVLAARRDLTIAVAVGEILLGAREIELVACSSCFLDAYQVFREQGRARLSFADAATMAIARTRGAEYVATFDRDFRGIPDLKVVP